MSGMLRARLLTLSLIVSVEIAACQSQTNQTPPDASSPSLSGSPDCQTIQHEAGETEICGQPQRIVVLGPYVLEFVLALGEQPVGFADHMAVHQEDYDNPSQQIPYLGSQVTPPVTNVGIAYTPSLEAIVKAQPDLILGTVFSNAAQYDELSSIAPTLLIKWEDVDQGFSTIAKAIDREEEATMLMAQAERRITSARETFAPIVEAYPEVLLLNSSQLREIRLGNSGHGLCSSLIKALGFQLVSLPDSEPPESGLSDPISIETLPQLNDADSIILLGSNFNNLQGVTDLEQFEERQLSGLEKAWEDNAIAQSLDASQADRVYFIPAYLCLGLPGPIGTKLYLKELQKQLLPSD
ncbi:MAG: iron-siderophore ABC transporter substrate-binding protein [Cyanobacteria bacterium J06626_4]